MNLGILINTEVKNGGAFQHGLSILDLLIKNFSKQNRWNLSVFTSLESNLPFLTSLGIQTHLYQKKPSLSRLKRALFKRNSQSNLEEVAKNLKIDLLYFLGPYDDWLDLKTIPYFFTVNDLCHRYFPEFPEVSANNEFERRDHVYGGGAQRALCTFVDSEVSKKDMEHFYRIDPDRICVFPFLPAKAVIDFKFDSNIAEIIKKKYALPSTYIYYPAQFWSHKNHVYLVEALSHYHKKYDQKLNLVFSGFDYGNKDFIIDRVNSLELTKHVHFLNFIDNEEVPYLYHQSIGLGMASYFGPTNLPPLEAFSIGVPVFYPNIPHFNSFLGDAAIYFDLQHPSSLAEHFYSAVNKDPMISAKTALGKELVSELLSLNRWKILEDRLQNFAIIRGRWK